MNQATRLNLVNTWTDTPEVAARVLVIDDDPAIVEMLSLNLHLDGYEVLGASNGHAGMELAAEELPDLIILDVMMPGIDGFEVLARLKAHRWTAEIPVVMLTARGADADIWRGWQDGVHSYLTKPHGLDHLPRVVAELLTAGRPGSQ